LDQLASIKNVAVTATNPSNPIAPSQVTVSIPFNWKDQAVIAVGLSYAVLQEQSWNNHDRLVLRLGYNHCNNQVPNETLSPLAPLILENHVTSGFGFLFSENWAFDLGAIYAFKKNVTHTNPSLPFGPNSNDSISAYYVYNTVSYRF